MGGTDLGTWVKTRTKSGDSTSLGRGRVDVEMYLAGDWGRGVEDELFCAEDTRSEEGLLMVVLGVEADGRSQ